MKKLIMGKCDPSHILNYEDQMPPDTGHIKKTTTEQIKKQMQHNYEENKKKEMELFYKGVPIKIRYNRGNEKLWE